MDEDIDYAFYITCLGIIFALAMLFNLEQGSVVSVRFTCTSQVAPVPCPSPVYVIPRTADDLN